MATEDEDKDPLSSANIFKDIGEALAKGKKEQAAFEADPKAHRFAPGEGVVWAHDNDDIFGPTLPEGGDAPADAKQMSPSEYEKHLASKGLNKPV